MLLSLLLLQKARTQDSAKAFMQGMCGGTHSYLDPSSKSGITGHDRHVHIKHNGCERNYTIHARPKHADPLLRFFDMCPAYDEYVAKINTDYLVSHVTSTPHHSFIQQYEYLQSYWIVEVMTIVMQHFLYRHCFAAAGMQVAFVSFAMAQQCCALSEKFFVDVCIHAAHPAAALQLLQLLSPIAIARLQQTVCCTCKLAHQQACHDAAESLGA